MKKLEMFRQDAKKMASYILNRKERKMKWREIESEGENKYDREEERW